VVALKVLSLPVDTATLRRFQRECDLVIGLGGHPHVVDVLDLPVWEPGCPVVVVCCVFECSRSELVTACP
jgi:hypothetical protein